MFFTWMGKNPPTVVILCLTLQGHRGRGTPGSRDDGADWFVALEMKGQLPGT